MAVWSKEVFARNLQYYMNLSGINQTEMAKITGVSAPTMNDYLKAKKYPRIDKIEKMADYFGILKSDLIEDKTEIQIQNHMDNTIIANLVVKMKTDKDFLSACVMMNHLDSEQFKCIKNMLDVFSKK